MAYPTKYTRQTDFVSYQAANPARPHSGTNLNVDYNAVQTSIDEIVEFLKGFTRSDGALANDSVGLSQLDASVNVGFSLPTTWATGTEYFADSTVFNDNAFYTANEAHTSGSTFDDSKWTEIVDFGAQATAAAASAADAEAAQTAAEAAQTAAELAETNAETAQAAAATSATNAATSATNAATSATNAATSATNAATSATNAATAETNAETAQAAAEAAQAAAELAEANIGTAIADEIGVSLQAYDADLSALAGVATAGLLARTGAGTAAAVTLTGTANEITVTNGNGIGTPTFSLPSTLNLSSKTVNLPVSAKFGSLAIGGTAITQSAVGPFLVADGMNPTNKYTPGIRFGSDDPDFTTTTPKFLAGIFGYATEFYAVDTDSGMGIEFFTTPNDDGTAPSPTSRMVIDQNGNVGINDTTPSYKLNVNGSGNFTSLNVNGIPVLTSSGGLFLASVRARATSGTLATAFENGDTAGGVTLATGDRILIDKGDSDSGVYTVNATGAPTRATDADADSELRGKAVFVTAGTYANSQWQNTNLSAISFGSTAITFSQIGASTSYTAGSGLDLTGTVFSVETQLAAINALTPTDGNFIVGNGTTWTSASLASEFELISNVTYPVAAAGDGDGAGGGTNDASALATALTAATGGILDLAGKTYRCDSILTIPSNTIVRNGVIDGTNITSTSGLLTAAGSDGTGLALSANATAGDITVSVSSTTGVADGDLIYLKSGKFFDAAGTITMGEWCRVASFVANTSVTFVTEILHSYTTANSAELLPRTWVENIRLENVELIGTSNLDNGFFFNKCRNIVVQDCFIHGVEHRLGYFSSCHTVQVRNCRGGDVLTSGLGYGFVFASGTENGLMDGCCLYSVGHGFAGGGTAGVTRFCKATNNIIHSFGGGLDAHPGTEEIDFINNIVIGPGAGAKGTTRDAVNINGRTATVIGNRIRNPDRHGILCSTETASTFTGRYHIADNDIESSAVTSQGIFVDASTCEVEDLIVANNSVNGFAYGLYVQSSGAAIDIIGFSVAGNVIGRKTQPATRAYMFEAVGGGDMSRGSITGNFGWVPSTASQIMRLVVSGGGSMTQIVLTGNNLQASSGGSVPGLAAVSTDYILCTGNIISTDGTEVSVAGANSSTTGNILI